jgi:hypothetical protein
MRYTAEPEQGEQLGTVLDELLPCEPHLPYANFAPLAQRHGSAQQLHRRRWLEPCDGPGAIVARADGGPVAALRIEARPFESEHFALRMARVEPPIAIRDDEPRLAALRTAYGAALAWLREQGFQHVALRTSTRDRVAPWVIQELGGVQVDTQVSWMAALTGAPHDDPLPPPLRLEVRDRAGLRDLDRGAWKRLAEWSGLAFDRGPLVFDLRLPRSRALRVYQAWTERVMTGDWADAVLMVWDGEEIVAFISMLALEDVSELAGVRVCGRGLGATLPEYRGLFTAIQREMIALRPLGASYMENETQAATIGSINVYAKLGFRYLRSTATFHRWADGAASRCG